MTVDHAAGIVSGQSGSWLRVFGLSAVLLGLQGVLGGFFYETNDDLLMELLLRGITGAVPVDNLYLYLHGWSNLLAALYSYAPAVPWYGLTLYVTLYFSLAICFWTLEEISRKRLNGWQLASLQIVFYALTFFLHAVQINFTRPALLLGAAAGLLLLTPRPDGSSPRWPVWVLASLALVAGWGLRPSGGILGLVLTLPLALWQGWARALRVAGYAGGLILLLTFLGGLSDTAEIKDYRRNDLERSRLFDYASSRLEIHTPTDSLAYATLVPYQGINDSVLLNPEFFRRAMQPAAGQHFKAGVYGGALISAGGSLVLRMPGCLLAVFACILLVASAVRSGRLRFRSWRVLLFGVYQGFFWLVFLALVSHMPLRVLQPIVTIYTIVNVIMVFGYLFPEGVTQLLPRWQYRALLVTGMAVGALWLLVNVRLVRMLSLDNANHMDYLAQLEQEIGSGILIEQGLFAAYPHLSPLSQHHLGNYRKIVMLTGWPAFDPSQPRLRQALVGTRDLAQTLQRLGQRPGTSWVMQPAFAQLLGRYLSARLELPVGQHIHFEPVSESRLPTPASVPPRRFRMYQGSLPVH